MRRLGIIAIVLVVLMATACSGKDDAVCSSLQTVFDRLQDDQGQLALTELGTLQRRVDATDNEALAARGRQFFAIVGEQVPDDSVTADQALAKGKRALLEGGAALGEMVDECNRQGVEIDLPSYDHDGKRLPR